ncbi:hypothetical protein F5B22DRAFT_146352 [Xylaria bambusicola]|uniref:uncharacterized protein n=1 Tax=Xylaria bambusicola TaxID=326684 RepID=UPI002008A1E1|nr:uncharacterized protein F5B22DRAFT_146352 [Xylaria bambusicola]KAI0526180.1 hypothetical protein F5B22DRAFT_146352 [Xylaria bambusicola]
MATVLGKRKSRIQKSDPSVNPDEVQAKLARCFAAQFPSLLPPAKPIPASEPEIEDDGSDGNSWDGFSEDGAEDDSSTPSTVVEVVSHADTYSATTRTLDKRESRAWLSSRPPLATAADSISSTNKKSKATTDEEDAPSLLKNDLALQRLLAESHLFSSAGADSGDATEHVGRNRHLATDLRLSVLGSKASIYKQEKMPMSMRKGIQAAAEGRETKRRQEARENGIVLERPTASKKTSKSKRSGASSAIDAPAVGRMNNGMLKLSKRDIADLEGGGPRKGGTFTKKRRR